MFSFLVNYDAFTTGSSYLDFGTPHTGSMSSESDIVWITSTEIGGWWTNTVTGWRYTGLSTTDYTALPTKMALTDTGSSCILGVASAIDAIKALAFSKVSTTADSGWGYYFPCNDSGIS